MSKRVEFSNQARLRLLAGVEQLANAVTSTLGPNGRNVIIEDNRLCGSALRCTTTANQFGP